MGKLYGNFASDSSLIKELHAFGIGKIVNCMQINKKWLVKYKGDSCADAVTNGLYKRLHVEECRAKTFQKHQIPKF